VIKSITVLNSKVDNVLNVIIIREANTKLNVEQHGFPIQAKQDQVSWRSKHPLLTDLTRRAPLVEIRNTELPVAKASMETTV
jgi:hypothetical protein